MEKVRAAALQINSDDDVERNLRIAERLVRAAAADGARFIALPENFALMAIEGVRLGRTESLDGEIVAGGRGLARELRVDLLLGSIPETSRREGMRRNCSVLVDASGEIAAVYRKIHLFDVELEEIVLKESSVV